MSKRLIISFNILNLLINLHCRKNIFLKNLLYELVSPKFILDYKIRYYKQFHGE